MIIEILWTFFLITTAITTVIEYRKDWTRFRSWFDSFIGALVSNALVYLLIFINFYIYAVL